MKQIFVLALATVLSLTSPMVLAENSACGIEDIMIGIDNLNKVTINDYDCRYIDFTQPGQTAACNNGFTQGSHIDCNDGLISLVTTGAGRRYSNCRGAPGISCNIRTDPVCCSPV
ncbi:hypothetical protein SCHPADRAFT_738978 [Schizopora paradoxa]|uniref:Uncharacterized protein n=1 Tax=Schizopora paradoxa TaxID=27342 RepID=A0A0H2R169_9AGAM|nr:hypothetical protein SCHPADRAFT_738978 [Schizopora paradoxa]